MINTQGQAALEGERHLTRKRCWMKPIPLRMKWRFLYNCRKFKMLSAFLAKACCEALLLADLDTDCLRPHAGCTVRLNAAGVGGVCLRIGPDGRLEPVHTAVAADASIEVPTPLAASGKPVYASGDSRLLAALRQAFESASLTPDAIVTRMFGSRAGAVAAGACDQAGRLGRDGGRRLASSFRSWLIDEAQLVPSPAEIERHRQQVEEFARRVESLRASLAGRARQ